MIVCNSDIIKGVCNVTECFKNKNKSNKKPTVKLK